MDTRSNRQDATELGISAADLQGAALLLFLLHRLHEKGQAQSLREVESFPKCGTVSLRRASFEVAKGVKYCVKEEFKYCFLSKSFVVIGNCEMMNHA